MPRSSELQPSAEIASDSGIHQSAESSDSDDQFTDAQSVPISSSAASPISKTRIDRIDDDPSHDKGPGTEPGRLSSQDTPPAENSITIDPDADAGSPLSSTSIPATVVHEAPGDVRGARSAGFERLRQADAEADLTLNSSGEIEDDSDKETSVASNQGFIMTSPLGATRRKSSRSAHSIEGSIEKNDFGDDFDDFEEGAEGEDFDDFEDGFQTNELPPSPRPGRAPIQSLPFPVPDFNGMSLDEITSATDPYLAILFPTDNIEPPSFPSLSKENTSIFSTPRSASLWSQLVAPPPLAPPDWIRSRTRRLFLVSLGVPVDLDEILPASKQKKLVLPSLNLPSASPRTSSDTRSASRLRQGDGNASSTSVDTQGKISGSKKRRGPAPPPQLDFVAARQLCTTTIEALDGMTEEELKFHVAKLESMQDTASEFLKYWQQRTDEKIGDREAFEGVIENLVKHARKVRK